MRSGTARAAVDVAPPCPRRAARFAHLLELVAPLRLDPEARVRAVRLPRIVAARGGLLAASRARAASRRRRGRRARHARPSPADTPAVRPRARSSSPGSARRRAGRARARACGRAAGSAGRRRLLLCGTAGEPRHRRLQRRHLAEVDPAGLRAERPAGERRSRPRRADDEGEPLLAAARAACSASATRAARDARRLTRSACRHGADRAELTVGQLHRRGPNRESA